MVAKPALSYEAVEVGQRLGPIRYRVEPEIVRLHLEAVAQEVPPFLADPETGALLMEPGILVRHYMRLLRNHFRVEGAIHARTEITLAGPARAGQTLTVTGRVAEKYIRRGRAYVVVESTTVDEAGREVCRARDALALAKG
jgi:acyl dehydratase